MQSEPRHAQVVKRLATKRFYRPAVSLGGDGAVGLAGVDLVGLRTSNKRPTESSWGLAVLCTPWQDPAVLGRLTQ
jgi:hypothetical protein